MINYGNRSYTFFKQHCSDEDAYHEWVVSQFNNGEELNRHARM